MRRRTLLLAPFLLSHAVLAAGPQVSIVVGPEAPALEKLAAEQLAKDMKALFDAEAKVQSSAPGGGVSVILIGSPTTNPAIPGDAWPTLSDQGHVLRSTPKGLIVGGGSPVATQWAASELAYHFGIRHLLHGDAMPLDKPTLKLEGIDKVIEPVAKARGWNAFTYPWKVFSNEPHSAISWSLEEHERLIKQLVKLKFTHYMLPSSPQAFAPISVDGDVGGRAAFKGAKDFRIPDDAKLLEKVAKLATEHGLIATREYPAGSTAVALGAGRSSVLPEFALSKLAADFERITHSNPSGFVAVVLVPGDLNAAVHYVSRASFEKSLTAEQSLEQLVKPICGDGVSERLWKGFQQIEKAAELITANNPLLGAPTSNMFLRHLESKEAVPAWITELKTLYTGAMSEMYRGNTRARGGARPFILYHAKRFEFAMQYCAAVEALRKAGHAKAGKNDDAAAEASEQGLEAIYNGLNAYADVARDSSDRGVIALLNEFGYRKLLKALEGQ
jgi:hypothetical protein